MMNGLLRVLAAASVLIASGHGREATAPLVGAGASLAQATTSGPALLPIALPDLSAMDASVQAQLRDAYASLPRPSASGPGAGEAYGKLGVLLMDGSYFDVAQRCFRNAEALAANDVRWPYYLGHLFISEGDLTKAVAPFERALRLRPDDLATLVWLGYVRIEIGQPEAAVPPLTRARALAPDTAAVPYQLGRASLAMRDYAHAVQYLEDALRLNPGATVIHLPLAMAYRGLGDLEKAQANLDQTRGHEDAGMPVTIPDPLMADAGAALRSPEVYWERGQQASAQGNLEEAVAQFRKALELAPDNAGMHLDLARALGRTGDPQAEMAELEAAIRADPSLAPAHFLLGSLLERSGRDQDAIDQYTAAVTDDTGFGEAHLRLADALRRTGRLDLALASYRRVLELEPANEEARFGEAMALAGLSRYGEARDRLRDAMSLHPDEPAFAQALARLLAASPDPEVRDGRRALELAQALADKYKTTSVAETMAMALAELGRFADAVQWQRLAMSVATDAGHADAAERMAGNLALYERQEPCRTPWRADDPEYRPGPDVEPGLLGPSPRGNGAR